VSRLLPALALLAVLAAACTAAGAARAPACFGAAARDAAKPCENPALRLTVRPSTSWAPLESNAPCMPFPTHRRPWSCWFGHRRHGASATVALVGDSHATSWRSAVAVLARAQRWHGITVRRSSCPFAMARVDTPRAESDACVRWVHDVVGWFGRHPEVHTVFVAASAYTAWVAAPGRDPYATGVAGFRAALAALPATVRRVVVLRDPPRSATGTLSCVAQAKAAGHPPGEQCALDRPSVLAPDPQVDAAQQLASPRYQVIDLTPFFCDDARCFPVIGGVLVEKDVSHLTTAYGTTLGPYLRAAYRRLPAP
jgi:SGNH domain (fused to AT3 domains)